MDSTALEQFATCAWSYASGLWTRGRIRAGSRTRCQPSGERSPCPLPRRPGTVHGSGPVFLPGTHSVRVLACQPRRASGCQKGHQGLSGEPLAQVRAWSRSLWTRCEGRAGKGTCPAFSPQRDCVLEPQGPLCPPHGLRVATAASVRQQRARCRRGRRPFAKRWTPGS